MSLIQYVFSELLDVAGLDTGCLTSGSDPALIGREARPSQAYRDNSVSIAH